MILTCFIIDDEPLALGLLESYVLKTPFLNLIGKFSSAISATSAISTTPPDLLFLDIHMAELSGMEFAKLVPPTTRIIFTTAFQQYALESYKVSALDYLLKPFGYPDFLAAANKALQWYQRSALTASTAGTTTIFVKADGRLLQVELAKILYIEGLKDYLQIYLQGTTTPITSHITLKAMEEMLPTPQFLRVHRSFIVQTTKITELERNRIIFGKTHIPVSDTYKDAFQDFLATQKLL